MSSMSGVNNSIVQSQLSSLQLLQQISTKVAAKSLDSARMQGAAALKLLDSAAQVAASDNSSDPTLNQLASGKGQSVDLYA